MLILILLAMLFCIIGWQPFHHRHCRWLRVSLSDVREAIAFHFPGEQEEEILLQTEMHYGLNIFYHVGIAFISMMTSYASVSMVLGYTSGPRGWHHSYALLCIALLIWSVFWLSKAMTVRVAITKSYVIWGDVRQKTPWNCRRRSDVRWASQGGRCDLLMIKMKGTTVRLGDVYNCGEMARALYANPTYSNLVRMVDKLFR